MAAAASPRVCTTLENKTLGDVQLGERLGMGTFGAAYKSTAVLMGVHNYYTVVKVFDDKDEFIRELSNHEMLNAGVVKLLNPKQAFPFPRLPPGMHAGSADAPNGDPVYFYRVQRAACRSLDFNRKYWESKNYPKTEVVEIVVAVVLETIRVCDVLATMGFSHGDINLGNILFHPDARHSVMLCDFGFLTPFGEKQRWGTHFTRSARYVREMRGGRGPITMFSDVEGVLYLGLALLGASYDEIDALKGDFEALSKYVVELDLAETNVITKYLILLGEVRAWNHNDKKYTHNRELAQQLVQRCMSLAESIGFKTFEEWRVRLPFYDAPAPTIGAAGCPKCGLMKRC
jgi:serine/threonine protein kinase